MVKNFSNISNLNVDYIPLSLILWYSVKKEYTIVVYMSIEKALAIFLFAKSFLHKGITRK